MNEIQIKRKLLTQIKECPPHIFRKLGNFRTWSSDKFSVLFAYPNNLEVGLSSLGLQKLAIEAIKNENFIVDEWFQDYIGNRSVQYKVNPAAFSIIGFSCQFELDYKNIVHMLNDVNIPVTSAERNQFRTRGQQLPLIIGGGIAISTNPLPLVPMMDFIFMFDSIVSISGFLKEYNRLISLDFDLESWWEGYEGEKRGIIPSFYDGIDGDIKRVFSQENCTPRNDDFQVPDLNPVVITRENREIKQDISLGTGLYLEVSKGCEMGCRFCALSQHLRPPRFRTLKEISKVIGKAKNMHENLSRIILIGSNITDHPKLNEILNLCRDNNLSFSLPSLKPNMHKSIFNLVKESGIHTLTIAPETGSDRLRRVINKRISNDDYFTLVKKMLDANIQKVKIYLLHGLPTETQDDLDLTVEFIQKIKDIIQSKGGNMEISINPFIPKMGTPFMFHVKNFKEIAFKKYKKQFKSFLRRLQKTIKRNIRSPSLNATRHQALLSIGNIIMFDHLDNIKNMDENLDDMLDSITKLKEEDIFPYPYDCIIPVSHDYLKNEWNRAMRGEISGPCNSLTCIACNYKGCNRWKESV